MSRKISSPIGLKTGLVLSDQRLAIIHPKDLLHFIKASWHLHKWENVLNYHPFTVQFLTRGLLVSGVQDSKGIFCSVLDLSVFPKPFQTTGLGITSPDHLLLPPSPPILTLGLWALSAEEKPPPAVQKEPMAILAPIWDTIGSWGCF